MKMCQNLNKNQFNFARFAFQGVQEISKGGSRLQADWEAVERTLYQEENLEIALKPNIAHECKLWKESFPYLRIRGQRIDNPINQRKQQLRQQVITAVVDQLIERIAGQGFNIGHDCKVQRPAAPSRESYFERGKHKQEKGSGTTLIPTSNTFLRLVRSKLPLPLSICTIFDKRLDSTSGSQSVQKCADHPA